MLSTPLADTNSPSDTYRSATGAVEKTAEHTSKDKNSAPVLKRLRKAGVKYALQVALAASSLGPMFTSYSSRAQRTKPEARKEVVFHQQKVDPNAPSLLTYQVSERDFAAKSGDSLKLKDVKVNEQRNDSTDIGTSEEKSTLFGYELDSKFAKVSASPRYKDGELKAKVRASLVRFSAKKEWSLQNGTRVQRGYSTRVRYEGEGVFNQDEGFGFRSKHVDAELGVEQRYDKTVGNEIQLSHRYFAGARYRYRFGETEGSEVRALVQTEQKAFKNDGIRILGEDFGWEARSVQTFQTNWGKSENNGAQADFKLEGLLTKKVDIKLLGKKREFRLKAGPEIKYSTRGGWSVSPEVGVKVNL